MAAVVQRQRERRDGAEDARLAGPGDGYDDGLDDAPPESEEEDMLRCLAEVKRWDGAGRRALFEELMRSHAGFLVELLGLQGAV